MPVKVHPCHAVEDLSNICGALRPLSAAVNSTTKGAAHVLVLCCSATHNDACADNGDFLSRVTRVERDYEFQYSRWYATSEIGCACGSCLLLSLLHREISVCV